MKKEMVVGVISGDDGEEAHETNLLNDEVRALLPQLFAKAEEGTKALAVVKFFMPDAGWVWYALEFDGKDTFYGLVIGFVAELSNFKLSDLEAIRGPLGLPVERDLGFEPCSMKKLRLHYQQEGWAI